MLFTFTYIVLLVIVLLVIVLLPVLAVYQSRGACFSLSTALCFWSCAVMLEEQQEQMSDKRNKKTKVQEQPVIPEPIDASRILFNKHIEHNCHFIFIHIFYYNNRYSTRVCVYCFLILEQKRCNKHTFKELETPRSVMFILDKDILLGKTIWIILILIGSFR